MKTEFLKSLGIEDQSVIDKIMAENGKDVNAARKNSETLEQENSNLKAQIQDRDKQLSDLKKSVKDNEELTQKITQLENDNKSAQKKYDEQLSAMQRSHAIENAVRDAKAKNAKAVIALLDQEKISFKDGELIGIAEQLKSLSESEDTGFLFGETPKGPSGTQPGNNPNDKNANNGNPSGDRTMGGLSLAEAIASAMTAKD